MRQTAEVLIEEILLESGVQLPAPKHAPQARPGAIHVAVASGDARDLGQGVRVSASKPGPEGYGLVVTPQGARVAGCDEAGAFYGCQTLLHLLRSTRQGAAIACVAIRDWPTTRLRMVAGKLPVTPGMIRLLARMKINYYGIYSTAVRLLAF